jgi:hypothetical protein
MTEQQQQLIASLKKAFADYDIVLTEKTLEELAPQGDDNGPRQ